MEIIINPIHSIICFNSGSAGDLIKGLCLGPSQYQLESGGSILLDNQYFKNVSKKIYHKSMSADEIDFTQVCKIENTHFYMDFYHQIANQIFYIDYPDEAQLRILNAVKQKRHNNDWDNFLKGNLYSIPDPLKEKINTQNVIEVFRIMWFKNLEGWRANKLMHRLNFVDFFDLNKLKNIVELVSGTEITNHNDFKIAHQAWLEKNLDLCPT